MSKRTHRPSACVRLLISRLAYVSVCSSRAWSMCPFAHLALGLCVRLLISRLVYVSVCSSRAWCMCPFAHLALGLCVRLLISRLVYVSVCSSRAWSMLVGESQKVISHFQFLS